MDVLNYNFVIGLQPTNTRAKLDSLTVFETNILRVSLVKLDYLIDDVNPSKSLLDAKQE